MTRYEVQLDISASVLVEVEADSEDEADEYARDTYRIGDANWYEVTEVHVTELAEGEA